MSRTPLQLAREFVGLVDGLNSVPGMMTSHDRGKEAMARALVAIADAHLAIRSAQSAYEDSDDQSTVLHQDVWRAEEDLLRLLDDLAPQKAP